MSAGELRLVFSATSACVRCRLRFPRRATCPACGGVEVVSLATPEGRARLRAAAGGQGRLLPLALWSPATPILVGLATMLAGAVGLALRGFSHERSTERLALLGLAVVGAVLLVVGLLARSLPSTATRTDPAAAARLRVFSPGQGARGDTSLTGVARRASVEIASAISGEPCLLFGVFGAVGDADVADADGGDFDLELPSGERVMISLEHAMVGVTGGGAEREGTDATGRSLVELLEARGIRAPEGRVHLAEHLVRDGDRVTVTGTLVGGTVTSLGGRGPSAARVLGGDEERWVIIEGA